MQDEKLQELFKRVDAQILEVRERQEKYSAGGERRQQSGKPPAGQEERRRGIDRRGRARSKEKD